MVQANDSQKKVVKPYTYQAKIDFKQKSNKRQKWALSNDHWDNSSGRHNNNHQHCVPIKSRGKRSLGEVCGPRKVT